MMLTLLDVVLGLALLFAALSVFCSSIVEMISARSGLRGRYLRHSLFHLLGEETLYRRLIHHPAVAHTVRRSGARESAPSYLATERFVAAVLDIIPNRATAMGIAGFAEKPLPADMDPQAAEFARAAAFIGECGIAVGIPLSQLAMRNGKSLDQLRKALSEWFDSQMDRAGGWYKRLAQRLLFAVGLVVALVLNVDTVQVARALAHDPALRLLVAAPAARVASEREIELAALLDANRERGLPVGYLCLSEADRGVEESIAYCRKQLGQSSWLELLLKGVGFLLTALSVSFGAPFWFDLLLKVSNLRATGARVGTAKKG
ncbi:hypothetical protein GCM10025771_22710 [Niveibacterium umoris]|uniref:Uncharacterized protein n=1 Tax=Niveibacterium umoris TaxID=1193620 RepID=A0A840BHT6_9RHOO|nr:hypothetical protein [Niveibacterium umoris]MBB4012540.1 hypothetical protein [Niveibacterium umoris]